jgi:replication factor A1
MNIPLPDILTKIKEQKGLDDAAINQKIDEKLQKLSGLVSKEGAAHILANELGVKLFENTGKIKDTYPGMPCREVNGRVLQVYEIREFDRKDGTKGYVGNFIIGDETGTLRIVCWGDQAQVLKKLEQGSIVKINDGVPKEGQRGTELHVSERTKVVVNPEGVEVQAYQAPQAHPRPHRVRHQRRDHGHRGTGV